MAWALLSTLASVSLGFADFAAAEVVMLPPTGLVLKKANSVGGVEVTVEWCAPRCVDGQNKTYAFQVSVYEAETSAEVSTEETHTEVGVMCQTPGGRGSQWSTE